MARNILLDDYFRGSSIEDLLNQVAVWIEDSLFAVTADPVPSPAVTAELDNWISSCLSISLHRHCVELLLYIETVYKHK